MLYELKTRYFSKNRRRTIIEREKSSLRRDITFLPFLAHFLLVLAQKTSLNKRNQSSEGIYLSCAIFDDRLLNLDLSLHNKTMYNYTRDV